MSIKDKVFYGKFQFGLLERLIVLEVLLYNAERMNYTSVSVESDTAVDFPYEKIVAGAYLLFNPKFHIFNFSINQVI